LISNRLPGDNPLCNVPWKRCDSAALRALEPQLFDAATKAVYDQHVCRQGIVRRRPDLQPPTRSASCADRCARIDHCVGRRTWRCVVTSNAQVVFIPIPVFVPSANSLKSGYRRGVPALYPSSDRTRWPIQPQPIPTDAHRLLDAARRQLSEARAQRLLQELASS
jgi:hypothetical protein